MTINYTTLLGLAQPVTGTEQGTWGDTVNTEITALLEDAIADAATFSVTSGDVTLTSTAGQANQARMAILLVTGTPGVSRNIIAPSQSKWYIVKNSSDASVVLKGSATTGVTILAGTEALCFWNGSDFEIVGVNGPSSSTDNAVVRFDSTTGKVIQNSGVIIDDSNNVSGMGTLGVGAITTTGVFTATAGTVSAPAITTTGDTNTGIFFPAADTIAFAEGGAEAMRINSDSQVVTTAGTVSLPAITTTGDLNTGIFFPAADTIAFAEGGAEAMRIDSSGNVGIGTSSPTTKLDVNGNIGGGHINVFGTNVPANGMNNVTTNALGFFTNSTERMRIDSSGNVGIGMTPNANTRLSIRTATTTDTAIYCDNTVSADFQVKFASGLTTITQGFNAPLAFATNNAERMRIDSSGNLCLATTTAVFGASNRGNLTIGGSSGSVVVLGTGNGSASYLYHDQSTSVMEIWNTANGNMLFGTNNTERARITSGGNLLVGTTAAGADAGFSTRLAVDGGSSVDPSIFKWSGTATSAFPIRAWNSATSGDNAFIGFATETTYTGRGSIDYNRGAGQVRYNTTSDATLKNIIGDSDNQKSVDILKSTRIREYAWKDDPTQKPQVGVIAQELYETYKGAVSVGGDFERERDVTEEVEEEYTDEEGNTQTRTVTKVVGKETYTQYRPWGVDKTAFTFHLIAGWQAHEKLLKEAMTRIEALEAEVTAMKGQ